MSSRPTAARPGRRRRRRRSPPDASFAAALLALALSADAARAQRPRGASPPSSTLPEREGAAAPPSLRRIAHYTPANLNWNSGLARPSNVDYSKVTRLTYPFRLHPSGAMHGTDVNADPVLLFGPYDWQAPWDAPKRCHLDGPESLPRCGSHHYEGGLIGGAHGAGTEVFPTIGGEGEAWGEVAGSPRSRALFAQNAAIVMETYDFDGIDMAWQFPQSPDDMANYLLLLSEVRHALNAKGQQTDKSYGLTVAVPCDASLERVDVPLLASVADELTLRSFDFHPPSDGTTGANAPLFDPDGDRSVDGCVRRYLEGGAPREKLNVGLAFSGRSFRGATSLEDGCDADWAGDCGDAEAWRTDAGKPAYRAIYGQMPEMAPYYDVPTETPWATYDGGMVTFDDPRSICAKTEYAFANGLGGVAIYDLAMDMLDDRSTPLLDAVRLKLLQPDIDCAGREFGALFAWRAVAPRAADVAAAPEEDAPAAPSEEGAVAAAPSRGGSGGRGPWHRYTCGVGEGNAKDRCSRPDLREFPCAHGACPTNMLCFVAECAKPLPAIPARDVEASAEEASHSKPLPKAKPRRKPRFSAAGESGGATLSEKVSNSVGKGVVPRDEREVTETGEASGGAVLTRSCGANFGDAASCRTPCPNGQRDCPGGEFCFYLECDAAVDAVRETSDAIPTSAGVPDATTATVAADAPEPATKMAYQCGETRDDALTCAEECGFAWRCPAGKDCYNVPCPA